MKLSVIIPCFNEVSTIEFVVAEVLKSPIQEIEIIIIDDFSTDGTRELLKNNLSKKVDRVIYHEKNQGKGAALRSGFQQATGEIIIGHLD